MIAGVSTRRALASTLAALLLLTWVGAAAAPYLVLHHPLLLLALSPWPRHQILVAPSVALPAYMAVIVLRNFVSAWLGYEIAVRYERAGFERLQRRAGRGGSLLRGMERAFLIAPAPAMMLLPGPITAAFAALAGARRTGAAGSLLLGIAGWAYVNYRIGAFIAPWTGKLLAYVREHLLGVSLACAAFVVVYQVLARKRRLRKLRDSLPPSSLPPPP